MSLLLLFCYEVLEIILVGKLSALTTYLALQFHLAFFCYCCIQILTDGLEGQIAYSGFCSFKCIHSNLVWSNAGFVFLKNLKGLSFVLIPYCKIE